MNLPYEYNDYAKSYNDSYIVADDTIDHVNLELELVETTLVTKNSWCDVACGTGYHLHHVNAPHVTKSGIDRAGAMLDLAKITNPTVNFVKKDLLTLDIDKQFDLVTNFWYGYIHQNSIKEVEQFFLKMVELTSFNGDILLAVCNPFGMFTDDNYQKTVYNRNMTVDAIVWSAEFVDGSYAYEHNIAPHPQLIINWIAPYFKTYEMHYSPKFKRQIIHLKEKI